MSNKNIRRISKEKISSARALEIIKQDLSHLKRNSKKDNKIKKSNSKKNNIKKGDTKKDDDKKDTKNDGKKNELKRKNSQREYSRNNDSQNDDSRRENLGRNDEAFIRKITTGYIVVPEEMFSYISTGAHIRYKTKNGEFRYGGYIWNIGQNDENRPYWIITKRLQKTEKTFTWRLYWDTVGIVWKKLDVEAELLRRSIDAKQLEIDILCDFLSKQFGEEFEKFKKNNTRRKRALLNRTESNII